MSSERAKLVNQTLLTDYYQITMMYSHYKNDYLNKEAVFDLFYRKNPCNGGYAIFAGLEQVINYIKNLKFTQEDVEYLSSVYSFEQGFLDYLMNFKFTGDMWSVSEGTVIFPYEPLIKIKTNLLEAHLIETAILNIINHQTLVATRASRVVNSAKNQPIMEFGLRRAQGPDAGVYGARATYIGGFVGTSNVLAGKVFSIPIMGTHAHSYIQSYPSELEAFIAFATIFPHNAILLVDTYDSLNSGIPNAIKTFKIMKEKYGDSFINYGIRLDSGDLAYLSKKAREMLDDAGFKDAKIVASNDLDEYLISDLNQQGACIDIWGVGTKIITSDGWSAFGGVYKLSAEIEDNIYIPKIKISENSEKVTTPGFKKLVRFYDCDSDDAILDLIMLADEKIPDKEFVAFDPSDTWKRKSLSNFYVKELLVMIFKNGEVVYDLPSLQNIRENTVMQLKSLSPEYKRLNNPHVYHVDLSQKLWDLKHTLINEERKKML